MASALPNASIGRTAVPRPEPARLQAREAPRPSTLVTTAAVVALTLVGGFLRLWHGTGQSLRLDEGFSVRIASAPLHPLMQGKTVLTPSLFQLTASDVHPPGYLLFLHFWMQWFGTSLTLLRLPSEIAGTLAVPALFLLASSLYGRGAGLLASVIGALSPFWIWHAQEVRMYPFLLLFTILSSYGLIQALRHHRAWGWALYFVGSLLAIYTQYFAFLVLVAQAVFMLLHWRQYRWRSLATWMAINVVMFLAYLPWLRELLINYRGSSDPSLTSPNLYTPLTILSQFLFGYLSVTSTSNVVAAWPLLVPAALALGIFGAAASRRAGFVWLLLLVPIAVAVLVTLTVRPFLSVRYLIVVTPALYTLLAVALNRLLGLRVRLLVAAVIAGLLLLSWHIEETNAGNPAMENYRSVARYIEAHARPGDVVGLDSFFNQDAYLYEAHNNLPTYALPPTSLPGKGARVSVIQSALRRYLGQIAPGRSRLWVVYYLEANSDPHNVVRHFLAYDTAGHAVILGGPYGRNQERYSGSYRNVQLVRYDLIPRPEAPQQVRPMTVEESRALTFLSPTTRYPFANPYGQPGSLVPMLGEPAAMPHPRNAWKVPEPSASNAHLVVFNPNSFAIQATLTPGGTTQVVTVPGHSSLDLAPPAWAHAPPGAALIVRSSGVIVPSLAWSTETGAWTRYGVPLP